jgi:predicted DNA-binding transcriptional regulator
MASKDQGIGAAILVVAVAVIIFYLWWLFFSPDWYLGNGWYFRQLAVALPVLLIVLAVLGIAAWIGYTMATTPPPKPLEEMPELSGSPEKKEDGEKKEPAK